MITRILPPEDWHRLEPSGFVPADNDPERTVAIAVENDEGEIIGCWLVMEVIHVEGLWIAPAHRKGSAVMRRLLSEMRQIVTGFFRSNVAWSAALPEDRAVASMLEAYGGVRLPDAHHYVFPVSGGK